MSVKKTNITLLLWKLFWPCRAPETVSGITRESQFGKLLLSVKIKLDQSPLPKQISQLPISLSLLKLFPQSESCLPHYLYSIPKDVFLLLWKGNLNVISFVQLFVIGHNHLHVLCYVVLCSVVLCVRMFSSSESLKYFIYISFMVLITLLLPLLLFVYLSQSFLVYTCCFCLPNTNFLFC